MMENKPYQLSPLWSHFTHAATEDMFQRAKQGAYLISNRWILLMLFAFTLLQGYGEMSAWVNAAQTAPQTSAFLGLRFIVLVVLATLWLRIPHLRASPMTAQRLSVGILALLSIQFILHQAFSTDALRSLRFPQLLMFTLFIYLLMPLKTHWVLLLGTLVSLAAYLGYRYQTELRGDDSPLGPSLLMLLVVNGFGAWMHRHRQFSERQTFVASELLTEELAQKAALVTRQREFVAILAHEVRNTLAILRAKSQLASLQEQRHLPVDIKLHSDNLSLVLRLQSLFDDVMADEKAILQPDSIKPAQLVAHDWLKNATESGHWALTRRVVISPNNASAKLLADPGLLHLIVDNLCSNAVKFSNAEQPLALAVRLRGSEIGIRVRDYGPGIDKQSRDLIFQKYARQSRHSALEGYGFGLFMANSLALRMQGRISLQSTLGRGSAFTVWLPRGAAP